MFEENIKKLNSFNKLTIWNIWRNNEDKLKYMKQLFNYTRGKFIIFYKYCNVFDRQLLLKYYNLDYNQVSNHIDFLMWVDESMPIFSMDMNIDNDSDSDIRILLSLFKSFKENKVFNEKMEINVINFIFWLPRFFSIHLYKMYNNSLNLANSFVSI